MILVMTPSGWADEAIMAKLDQMMAQMDTMRSDYEARINQLQQQINGLKNTQQESLARVEENVDKKMATFEYVGRKDGPFERGGLVATTPSGVGQVSLGGYADIELENFQESNSEFDQHRFVLNVGATLGERLRFYSEYEIEHGGPSKAGGEAKVEQAYIDFLINDAVNFRAGALLVPFGRYNLYHDSDVQDLTDRPLVNRDIIPTTWTESGAGFFGEFNPTIGAYEDLQVKYETYIVNGLADTFSDTGLRGARGALGSDNNNSKSIVGRVQLSPAIGHEIGVSGYWGDVNGQNDDIKAIGLDFLSTWGSLELIGEWALFLADDVPAAPSTAGGPVDSANQFTGGYLQANYHFWFDFLDDTFLGKSFEDPTFTLVGRFGWAMIDDDVDATLRDNEERRFTLGLNYRPVESWVLKLEYQNNHTDTESLERGDAEGFIASIAMGF